MSRHAKTIELIETAKDILSAGHPMTVRQVYYQLVSRQVIKNSRGQYQAVSNALVDARREGLIPWEWIEDRLRRPRSVDMWSGMAEFGETCRRAYRRDVWSTQPTYLEVWLEKDALSGIFEDVLDPYGVTLNVGRGYDGWSSIHNAATRFTDSARAVTVLYFGDFDPSGEDMVRSLEERLADQGAEPEVIKCALTAEDIERYNLPPDFAKKTDTRAAAFIAEHGDISVELDALPADVLRNRIEEEVKVRMDLEALENVKALEEKESAKLGALLGGMTA
ncbi:MAG TPA: hypothetical protein PKW32_09840 [Verrucomicrobiota bacterium]|nr:hypothetical protein [Verrucomicrobiota bacterium]